IGRVNQLRRGAVVHGEAPGNERRGAELAPLVHRVELEVELGPAALIEQPGLRQLYHPLHRFKARVGGLHAPTHELDREEPSAHLDVRLPPTGGARRSDLVRSEEHTSELQSLAYLVCRLLLEKKTTNISKLMSTLDFYAGNVDSQP